MLACPPMQPVHSLHIPLAPHVSTWPHRSSFLFPCSVLSSNIMRCLILMSILCLCVAQSASSSGSGLILDPDGTILTSAQIVSAAAEARRGVSARTQQPKVLITLQDRRVFQGRVISSDRYSTDHLLDLYLSRPAFAPTISLLSALVL